MFLHASEESLESIRAMYGQALSHYQALEDEQGRSSVYMALGNLSAHRGLVAEAVENWSVAADQYRKAGDDDQVQKIEAAIRRIWTKGSEIKVA